MVFESVDPETSARTSGAIISLADWIARETLAERTMVHRLREAIRRMTLPDRLTLRLGSLAQPLDAWCSQHECTPSDAVRRALARMLDVDVPKMPIGDPTIGRLAKSAAAARWGAPDAGP